MVARCRGCAGPARRRAAADARRRAVHENMLLALKAWAGRVRTPKDVTTKATATAASLVEASWSVLLLQQVAPITASSQGSTRRI